MHIGECHWSTDRERERETDGRTDENQGGFDVSVLCMQREHGWMVGR